MWLGPWCNCSFGYFEQSRAMGIMTNKTIKVEDWGSLSYEKAWQMQEDYFSKIISRKKGNRKIEPIFPTDNYLFFVEHPPVFTLKRDAS